MDVKLIKTKGLIRWLQVFCLYRQAFPPAERKPFSRIRSTVKAGKCDLWTILDDGRFAGFASTVNGPQQVMLDYLATLPNLRGAGIGTRALRLFLAQYPGKGVFVEIESPFADAEDRDLRLRRKAFYGACGLEPMGVTAMVFGVEMELLGKDCMLDYTAYHAFYRDNYSPWAAEHLSPLPYPET